MCFYLLVTKVAICISVCTSAKLESISYSTDINAYSFPENMSEKSDQKSLSASYELC